MLDNVTHPTVRTSDSNSGFQFVGCAPGPERGTLLLGMDGVGEAAMLARPSMSTSTDKTLTPLFPSPGPSFTGRSIMSVSEANLNRVRV